MVKYSSHPTSAYAAQLSVYKTRRRTLNEGKHENKKPDEGRGEYPKSLTFVLDL